MNSGIMWKRRKSKETSTFNAEKVFLAATQPLNTVCNYFQTSKNGLTSKEIENRQSIYGTNEVGKLPKLAY